MNEVNIRSIDGHIVNGTFRSARESGDTGIACLLVHGITADRHEWGFFDYLTDALHELDVATLSIDYRGHGESKLSQEHISLSGIYSDIAASWSWFQKAGSWTESILIGNSFGAGVAYVFGQLEQSASRIVLTCPVTSYLADLGRVNPAWATEIDRGSVKYANMALSSGVVSEMMAYDSIIASLPSSKRADVIHGTDDADVPYEEVALFASKRRHLTLHPMAGMDHSFSAPPGSRETSDYLRASAAHYIANLLVRKVDDRV